MSEQADILKNFRKEKDQFFATHSQSPLPANERAAFKGLNYFPEAPELRFEVGVEPAAGKEQIEIQTSTGDTQTYQRYGKFRVSIEGQEVELTIFSNEQGFFLPFVDSLRGKETYPAGRYLEPEELPEGRFLIDFNYAYNPYCAYADKWSCPLTPFENHLKVPVRAGEKIYHDDSMG